MSAQAPPFFLPGQSREVAAAGRCPAREPLQGSTNARAATSPNAGDGAGTRAGDAGATYPSPGILLHQIPAAHAGDAGGDATSPQAFPPVGAAISAANSPAGALPCQPAGAFSGEAIAGLALGLTELSSALLTIARALQQLAPHPATVTGPVVSHGPEAAEGRESTGTPQRGAEPRRQPALHSRAKPHKWTDERRELLIQMRRDGRPAPEILAALNEREGEAIELQQMHSFAYSIGIRTGGPAPRSATSWNDARDAALVEAWRRGDEPDAILPIVNAIPGSLPVKTADAVKTRAHKLKVRRSPEAFAAARLRAAEKMRGTGRTWSDEMTALLRHHYPLKTTPLPVLAGMLTQIADGDVSVQGMQQKAHNLGLKRKKGMLPGTKMPSRAKEPAAAAAQVRASGPPPAPKAAPAAPPVPTEIPRAEVTNPAREMAVSEGHTSRPDTQPRTAAVGAPRPNMILGHNGARIDLPAVPKAASDDAPPPYDASRKSSVEARVEKAREMLRGKTEPHLVVMHTRLPLREVFRLQMEVRAERAA